MSSVQLDVASVRSRFTALRNPFLYFDGPSGTQTPDEVIAAIVKYLHEANANMGAQFETSRRTTETYLAAREAAARFFGSSDREIVFGPNMTSLNFMLTRTFGRTLSAGDEIVSTKLDHDGNVAPWLELARDVDLTVRFAELTADGEGSTSTRCGQRSGRGRRSFPSRGRRTRSGPARTRRRSSSSRTTPAPSPGSMLCTMRPRPDRRRRLSTPT